jgi:hypothetical protein
VRTEASARSRARVHEFFALVRAGLGLQHEVPEFLYLCTFVPSFFVWANSVKTEVFGTYHKIRGTGHLVRYLTSNIRNIVASPSNLAGLIDESTLIKELINDSPL